MKSLKLLAAVTGILFFFSCSKSVSTGGSGTGNNPVPVFAGMSPSTALAGSAALTITITGTNFINGSVVLWNGVSLTTTYISPTILTVVIPAANMATAGNAAVTVFSASPGGGTSSALTFTITANNPLPILNTLLPNNADAGSGSFTMTVTGTNFINASAIKWNGTTLSTTYISPTQLSTFIAAANIATAGTASISVFTPLPGGGTSNALNFTINPVSTVKRFLFDASHAETAGNADWVIDEDNSIPQQIPTPAQSTVNASTPETYWTGAIFAAAINVDNCVGLI